MATLYKQQVIFKLIRAIKIPTSALFTIHVSLAGGREGSDVQFKFTHCPIEYSAGTCLI